MTPGAVSGSGWRALRDGLIVGVTNPKTFILFGAILPQFVSRGAGDVPGQMLLLALVSVCLGLASDSAWGLAATGARAWLARSPRRLSLVGGAGGLAMITVGVTIAVTGRKGLRVAGEEAGHDGADYLRRGVVVVPVQRHQPGTRYGGGLLGD
jgi:threonine/homoserine/homoserine lactone efflux protein